MKDVLCGWEDYIQLGFVRRVLLLYGENFWGGIFMSTKVIRNKKVNVRLNDDEFNLIKQKAGEGNVSMSEFMRKSSLDGKVNHINNGKEIAKGIALLHNKMQLYRQDITEQIHSLQSVITENNRLLNECWNLNNREIADTLKYQNCRINSVFEVILNRYNEHERQIEDGIQNLIRSKGAM